MKALDLELCCVLFQKEFCVAQIINVFQLMWMSFIAIEQFQCRRLSTIVSKDENSGKEVKIRKRKKIETK